MKTSVCYSATLTHSQPGPTSGVCALIRRSARSCRWREETAHPSYTCMSSWTPSSRTSPWPNTWVCGCQATSTGTTRSAQQRIKRIPPCTSLVATCQHAPAAPESTRLDRYITMPHLQYCCNVWDPHKKKSKDQLEMFNRRAAGCVFNKRWRDRAVSPTAILR